MDLDIDNIVIDLSKNSKTLKRSIFLHILKLSLDHNEIEDLLYDYIYRNLDGNDGYREYLALYEKPLLKAGLKKFGSKLKLSQILGINRNTLRKKIHEYDID